MVLLARFLKKKAAAMLALCALAVAIASAGASYSSETEAATFAAAAPAAAAATAAAVAPEAAAAAAAPSPSSSLETLDPTSAAIAAAAAAVDAATVDALLRIRSAVSPSDGGGKKGEEAAAGGPEVADSAADSAADAAAPGPLSAPSSSSAAATERTSSTLARESQEAYRSYKGLVPGSRFAELAPPGAFPGSPPARAESALGALGGRATLTPPGEATAALVASLPPPGSAAPAPSSSSYSRGRGKRNPPAPSPSPSGNNNNPKGDSSSPESSKRIWKLPIDASAAAERQPFEGWGTSLAWWALVVGSFADSVRSRVADLIFDAGKGLGLEVVRYNIGGSGWDCPGKSDMRPGGAVPSFLSPDWKTFDWSLDAGQRWTLLAARDRGASVFEAFSNSPPCFMTKSGYASGNWDANDDNLPAKNYEAFASYLAEVVSFYRKEHNITFRTLDAFNEPMTNYWYAGNAQEGCHFDRSSQSAFLPVMSSELKKRGLEKTVELSASDETCIASAEESLRSWTPEALSAVSQVNTHTYWGPSYPRAKLAENAQKLGKRLWQSEYGAGAAPPWEMPDALSMGTQIAADLNVMGARAWVYWQAVENLDGKPPTPWWGLAQLSFGNGGSGLRTGKQFWALAQFSKSIRSGATVLASPRAADTVVALQPRKGEDGKIRGNDLVIVMTNVDREEAAAAVDVSSFLLGSSSSSSSSSTAATVKAWRTSASEDRADAGELGLAEGWGGKFDVRLAPESLTTLVVSLA